MPEDWDETFTCSTCGTVSNGCMWGIRHQCLSCYEDSFPIRCSCPEDSCNCFDRIEAADYAHER